MKIVTSDVLGAAFASEEERVTRIEVDAFGAAQYEVSLSLASSDGGQQRFVLSTQAATAVGVALIAEAETSTHSSEAEFDALLNKHPENAAEDDAFDAHPTNEVADAISEVRETTVDETTLLEPAALRHAMAAYLDERAPLADPDALGERIATTLWAIHPASAVDALASVTDHLGAFDLGYCVGHERGRTSRGRHGS